jgi:hypothetical protein
MSKFFLFLFCCLVTSNIYAQSISPVFLLYPQNEQILQENTPTFSWSSSSIQHTYVLRIVEVEEGQTPEGAFQSNLAYYYQDDVRNTSVLYSFGGKNFVAGKKYAWAVCTKEAQSKNVSGLKPASDVGKTQVGDLAWSEIYVFRVDLKEEAKPCDKRLEIKNENLFSLLVEHKLLFTLPLEFEQEKCEYRFLNQHKEVITEIQRKVLPIQNAHGYEIALRQYAFFREKENQNQIFIFEITSKSGEKIHLKFLNN